MANRERSRSRARQDRDRGYINALIDANRVPESYNKSQVVRLGSMALTTAKGDLNSKGKLFESIVNERANLPRDREQYSTDPFRRGTRIEGPYIVADRRSGQSVRVARILKNGQTKVLQQGEAYYKDNRSEFVVHLPVWHNFSRRRVEGAIRSNYDAYRDDPITGQQYTIPITDLALLDFVSNDFANPPNLTYVRSRAATTQQQKAFLKDAVTRWLMDQSTTRDEHGRIPLQEFDRSDSYFSFDPADIDTVEFTFDEIRTHFQDRSDPPSVETILGRTLHGKVTITDYFWNKQGLCDEAFVEQADGGCVREQLSRVAVRRQQIREPRVNGVRNETPLVDHMIPAFTKEEFSRRYHDAFKLQYPGRPMGPMRESVAKEFDLEEQRQVAKRHAERYGTRGTLLKYVQKFIDYTRTGRSITAIKQYCSKHTIAGFTPDLRSCFGNTMPVDDRYRSFFKSFPEYFVICDDHVTSRGARLVEGQQEEEHQPEQKIRDPPYHYDDYRYIGDNHYIVRKFCEMNEYPVYIMYQNILLDKYIPEGWTYQRTHKPVVYQIHDDHAYFYNSSFCNGVQNMRIGLPKHIPKARLLYRLGEEDDEVNFKAMHPYSQEDLTEALDAQKSIVFFTEAQDLALIAKYLNEDIKVAFHTSYEDNALQSIPERIRRLTIYAKQSRIVIRKVPVIAEVLEAFCNQFEDKTGFKLQYKGQALPTLAYKAICALLVTKRKQLPKDIRHELAVEQEFKCPLCTEQLPNDLSICEVDHIRRLDQGGRDDKSNMQLLHRLCHRCKTQKEHLSLKTAMPRIESQFNPYVKELFDLTAMPTQVVWGKRPETSEVMCIDIRSCRPTSIFTYPYDLPVFSPNDDPQECVNEHGSLLHSSLEYFDFYLVDASETYNVSKPEVLDGCRPYYGRKLYDLRTVQYMLDERIIYTKHLVFGLKATTRFPVAIFKEAFETVKHLIGDTVVKFEDFLYNLHQTDVTRAHGKGNAFDIKAYYEKVVGLQLLGVLGKDPGHMWSTIRSRNGDDCPGEVHSITCVPGEEVPYLNVRTKLLDIQSTKPWKLIVLNGEQIALREMRKFLDNTCPAPYATHGERVDCIYFSTESEIDEELLKNGGYKLTTEPSYLVPTNPKSAIGCNTVLARVEKETWLSVYENDKASIESAAKELDIDCCSSDWDNCRYLYTMFAKLIVANKGGYISGAAGVGKTTLIKQIKEQILEETPDAHIITMSVTHVAARLAQGCTISHALRKFAKVQNAWIFIDECSQVPLSMLGEISRWHLVGCKFVIVEDRIGQFLPIYDTWDVCLNKLPEGTLMKVLCGGLRIQLDIYKRGQDQSLFDFYHGLYSTDVDDQTLTQDNVAAACAMFKMRTEVDIQHYFVLSHRKRLLLNAWKNTEEAHGKDTVFIKSAGNMFGTTAPTQDMLLWVGIELVGCAGTSGKVVNGVTYEVTAITEDTITVTMGEEFRSSLVEMTNDATRNVFRGQLEEEMPVVLSVLQSGPLTPATLANKARICQSTLKRLFPTSTTPQRWIMLCQLFPSILMTYGNKIGLKDAAEEVEDSPDTVTLSHEEASMYLRLTYALTYASIQGRTIRNKNICLMDTTHRKFFTTRHLIVGVSRATHGRFVHVPTEKQEHLILRKADSNASLRFLESVESQEHMATPEEEIAPHVATGQSSCVIQSLIATPPVELENSTLAGSRRLRCEPCFNTLKSDEQSCIFCGRSRLEIAESCV